MSHEIESAFIAGETKDGLAEGWWDYQKEYWQRELMTPTEAWEKGPIKWEVDLVPIEFNGEETDYNLVVRDTDDKVLSCVGSQFTPLQNWDLMQMMMAVTEAGHNLGIESVLSLKGGKVVAIGARRPEPVKIADDTYLDHMTGANWHGEGRRAMLYFSKVRTECWNTLRAGIESAPNVFRFRHTGNMQAKIEKAKQILEVGFTYQEHVNKIGNEMALKKMSEKQFEDFLKKSHPVKSDDEQPVITRVMNTREGIKEVYRDSDDLQNLRGTAWGAMQATIEYYDHKIKYQSPDNRFVAALTQDNGNQRAFDVLRKQFQIA